MGRHLCKVVETFTLKTNGYFSITLSFFYGPARKLYKPSALNLVFRLLRSVYQGKNPQQTKPPVLPHMPWIRCVHPTTQALFLLHNVVCPHTYRQPLSIQPLSSGRGGGGVVVSAGHIRTFRQKEPMFHGFLSFPPTSSLPCHCPKAATSFLWNISPWLCLISSSVLCSPWKSPLSH